MLQRHSDKESLFGRHRQMPAETHLNPQVHGREYVGIGLEAQASRTGLRKQNQRAKGFEPSTSTLARCTPTAHKSPESRATCHTPQPGTVHHTDTQPEIRPDPGHSEELAAIADLLVNLPTCERQEAIAELPVNERVQLARLLIARRARRSTSPAPNEPEAPQQKEA